MIIFHRDRIITFKLTSPTGGKFVQIYKWHKYFGDCEVLCNGILTQIDTCQKYVAMCTTEYMSKLVFFSVDMMKLVIIITLGKGCGRLASFYYSDFIFTLVFSSVHEDHTDMEQNTSSATYQDEHVEAEQIVKLQEELHITKSLVHELKTDQEKQCQERKALEERHGEEMSAKDDAIVHLKHELDEAHQKISMLESQIQMHNQTHNLSCATEPIPAATLNTLVTQGIVMVVVFWT